MAIRLLLVALTLLAIPLAPASAQDALPAAAAREVDIDALLARMTTAEKVGQLVQHTLEADVQRLRRDSLAGRVDRRGSRPWPAISRFDSGGEQRRGSALRPIPPICY